ncbi:MAG: hypothetical protein ACTHMW_15625, partial [Actinomycetes bacterium]
MPQTRGPVIRGRISIDLRGLYPDSVWPESPEDIIRRSLDDAIYAPAGADVEILVSPKQYAPIYALRKLTDLGSHLGSVTVICSEPETV